MGNLRTSLTVLLAAAAFPAAASAAEAPLAGTYEGQEPGLTASAVLDEDGDGTLDYSLKTDCGNAKGTMDLTGSPSGSLKGSQSSRKSSLVVSLKPDRGSPSLDGSLKYTTTASGSKAKGRSAHPRPCRAKQSFTLDLDVSSSPQVRDLSGHYTGKGEDGGLPISFDVGFDQHSGSLRISNLAFQTDTECDDDLDGDGEYDELVAKISGLEGEVDSDGEFEIDYSPDDDTDYYVEGTLEDGQADIYLEVGGYFAADGTPRASGPNECDSYGEDYTAQR